MRLLICHMPYLIIQLYRLLTLGKGQKTSFHMDKYRV
jgi:hypothetical protein